MSTPTPTQKTKTILITGAAGLLGPLLTQHLLSLPPSYNLLLTDISPISLPFTYNPSRITVLQGDLSSPTFLSSILSHPLNAVYILHGIMSSTAEANYPLSLKINVYSILSLTEQLRLLYPGIRTIFTSSIAIYGHLADPTAKITENVYPRPETTYGAHKLMIETHLTELHRKGFLDVIIARLPTISVRPGKPTGAASSFLSGIIREPMQEKECIVPIEDRGFKSYLSSPGKVIENLGRVLEWNRLEGNVTVQFPGISVSIEEMIDALRVYGGEDKVRFIKEERDERLEKILRSWPRDFDVRRGEEMGLGRDEGVEGIVGIYIEGLRKDRKF
ncbi:hypothetical protein QBC38DRAFT_400636 [Podospora fimiseda]|uniref:NAD-dependent epimerase/dehydratase domain-containing protein n=1 Tax=Podospora fimiseda TaxID=252190 RepID=A0AAN6YS16_9PEZI|nr:hypothetical protein QBC38DRAFT_400636 [Podospora fimiseda]